MGNPTQEQLYPPKIWTIIRSRDGVMQEIIIQKGRFWHTNDIPYSGEDEPETGFDKRPSVG